MMASSRVLVTGATGYIATHVVQQLQQQGYAVRGTVRSKANEKKVKPLFELCPTAKHPLELVEADLTKDDGWVEAIDGCTYVMHIASPFPSTEPRDEQEVIGPAVEGTMRVLRACKQAQGVKRVVLTSSAASIAGAFNVKAEGKVYTEDDWTDLKTCPMAYAKSKTLAEKAAWDFMNEWTDANKFDLAIINPTYVMGPVLCGSVTTSMEVIKRMLEKAMPLLPRLNFDIVDVRDVAASHLAAMTVPEAGTNRHIISGHCAWMYELAAILDDEFKAQGYSIPTSNAPYPLLWLFSKFDKTVQLIMPSVGNVTEFDNHRMKNILGVVPRSMKTTVIDMAYSMIENGSVKKTSKYQGPASVVA